MSGPRDTPFRSGCESEMAFGDNDVVRIISFGISAFRIETENRVAH